jgi:preprotein translocase subunit SecG
MTNYLFMVLLLLTALFLILIILIQRGKGGGLAGAFGGAGGQSAFGTKAGDLFTKITIGVAAVWIALCVLAIVFLQPPQSTLGDGSAPASQQAPDTGDSAPNEDG